MSLKRVHARVFDAPWRHPGSAPETQIATPDALPLRCDIPDFASLMVDNCHALRMVLKELKPKPGGVISGFLEKYDHVTRLRNAMDHLRQQIGNLAKRKKPMPPLFGALSFVVIDEKDVQHQQVGQSIAKGAAVVTLTAGSLVENNRWQIARDLSGRDIEFPVGQFQLEAFDEIVNLSEMVRDAEALVTYFETDVRHKIEQRI